eukprot:gnl/Chilomastix_cuspidata/3559.p2 GENE.gnl/Chilomastix_cuspidata/3559~~gnl/Chilomastix_cuspidata/3559.p2  ORF type:complete len:1093 (+),score=430.71 gnl/Chilomastix_cuspidata/3559:270-3281(+)
MSSLTMSARSETLADENRSLVASLRTQIKQIGKLKEQRTLLRTSLAERDEFLREAAAEAAALRALLREDEDAHSREKAKLREALAATRRQAKLSRERFIAATLASGRTCAAPPPPARDTPRDAEPPATREPQPQPQVAAVKAQLESDRFDAFKAAVNRAALLPELYRDVAPTEVLVNNFESALLEKGCPAHFLALLASFVFQEPLPYATTESTPSPQWLAALLRHKGARSFAELLLIRLQAASEELRASIAAGAKDHAAAHQNMKAVFLLLRQLLRRFTQHLRVTAAELTAGLISTTVLSGSLPPPDLLNAMVVFAMNLFSAAGGSGPFEEQACVRSLVLLFKFSLSTAPSHSSLPRPLPRRICRFISALSQTTAGRVELRTANAIPVMLQALGEYVQRLAQQTPGDAAFEDGCSVAKSTAACLINLSVNAVNKELICEGGGLPIFFDAIRTILGAEGRLRRFLVLCLRVLCNLAFSPTVREVFLRAPDFSDLIRRTISAPGAPADAPAAPRWQQSTRKEAEIILYASRLLATLDTPCQTNPQGRAVVPVEFATNEESQFEDALIILQNFMAAQIPALLVATKAPMARELTQLATEMPYAFVTIASSLAHFPEKHTPIPATPSIVLLRHSCGRTVEELSAMSTQERAELSLVQCRSPDMGTLLPRAFPVSSHPVSAHEVIHALEEICEGVSARQFNYLSLWVQFCAKRTVSEYAEHAGCSAQFPRRLWVLPADPGVAPSSVRVPPGFGAVALSSETAPTLPPCASVLLFVLYLTQNKELATKISEAYPIHLVRGLFNLLPVFLSGAAYDLSQGMFGAALELACDCVEIIRVLIPTIEAESVLASITLGAMIEALSALHVFTDVLVSAAGHPGDERLLALADSVADVVLTLAGQYLIHAKQFASGVALARKADGAKLDSAVKDLLESLVAVAWSKLCCRADCPVSLRALAVETLLDCLAVAEMVGLGTAHPQVAHFFPYIAGPEYIKGSPEFADLSSDLVKFFP